MKGKLRFGVALAAVFTMVAAFSAANAQSWPTQPVKIVVGFPPGGTTDVIGRLVAETGMGLEGFEILGWFGLFGPAGTPPEVVRRLNAEVNAMIARPAIVQRFAELGAEPLGGTPADLASFLRAEREKWGRVIRDAGVRVQ